MAAFASMAPKGLWAQARAVSIVALGGAGAERPAGTRSAFEQAIAEGADYIETSLAATQDGTLVACDNNELSGWTDIVSRPEFSARRTTKTIDGAPTEGWFTEDFALAELKMLVNRDPAIRSRSRDSRQPPETILTFQDVIDLARAASTREARVIGVCATLRRSGYFASIDLALEPRLADLIRVNGYNWRAAAMIVQSHEADVLKTLGGLTRARRTWLMPSDAGPSNDMASIRAYAEIIGPPATAVLDLGGPTPVASPLVASAHAAGLAVQAQARPTSDPYPPRPFRRGDLRGLFAALAAAGVDAIATDTPAAAGRARDS